MTVLFRLPVQIWYEVLSHWLNAKCNMEDWSKVDVAACVQSLRPFVLEVFSMLTSPNIEELDQSAVLYEWIRSRCIHMTYLYLGSETTYDHLFTFDKIMKISCKDRSVDKMLELLPSCTSLTYLECSSRLIDALDASVLPSLTGVSLVGHDNAIPALVRILRECRNLKHFKCSNAAVVETGSLVRDIIQANPTLEYIMTRCGGCFHTISSTCPTIRSLDIPLSLSGVTSIISSLAQFSQLEELRLGHSIEYVRSVGRMRLSDGLPSDMSKSLLGVFPALKDLVLELELTDELVSVALKCHARSLTRLSLGSSYGDESRLTSLSVQTVLTQCTALRILNIFDMEREELWPPLEHVPPELTHLWLTCRMSTDDMVRLLTQCRHLKHCNLSVNIREDCLLDPQKEAKVRAMLESYASASTGAKLDYDVQDRQPPDHHLSG